MIERMVKGLTLSISKHLNIDTAKQSKQTKRIADLEQQVCSLGSHPVGREPEGFESQLQHSRAACLLALRVWNDPQASFKTSAFALLLVTAWNSLALALLQRDGVEWRRSQDGEPVMRQGLEMSLGTDKLVSQAFQGGDHRGLRKNVKFWLDLRNCVAHRHLPALDISVIPYAQAGLLNYERVISEEFGASYQLAEYLSVPLQLSGFRDPDVLSARRRVQASLPFNVQALLSRVETDTPELLTDETFMMRVAFIPFVPASGRNPDVVAYFVRPGEVPDDLSDILDRYAIIPKRMIKPQTTMKATEVVKEVKRRIPFTFNTNDHAAVGRHLGVRAARGDRDRTFDAQFCEYLEPAKMYVYTRSWIGSVVDAVSTEEGFLEATGRHPVPKAVPKGE